MSITQLDAKALKEAFISGLLNLKEHKEEVDSLNVFPVPDGDTGTNMVMTMEGGTHAAQDGEQERIDDFLKRFARGVLLGAFSKGRGKSLRIGDQTNRRHHADRYAGRCRSDAAQYGRIF